MSPDLFVRLDWLRRTGLGAVAALSLASPGPGAEPLATLDEFVLSVTRTPVAPRRSGSVVDRFDAEELARRQVTSLAQALGAASLPVFGSGQPGASTSLFLRGANSNQTLFLVDGLRISDPNTDYLVFLGGGCVSACDSLEIAHGPQSTLYGGEAVGGVVSLRSQRGAGRPTGKVAVEAGSFGTVQGAASAQGEQGRWAYSLALQGGRTENDRANNGFDSGNLTGRVDRRVTDRISVGATLRGFEGVYGSPGTRYVNDPDNEERERNWMGTLFATVQHGDSFSSHAVLGGQHRRFVSESPRATGGAEVTLVRNRRAVLDWQGTYTGLDRHRVTAGFTAEKNHTRNTGFGDIDRGQELLALFVQDEYAPTEHVALTAGLRHDDFDTFGRHMTGRVTAAWSVAPDRVKLRASFGTAFRSPSFLDLYGQSAFYVGNPALKPERSRGGDVGIDVYLPDGRSEVSLTWFENRFTDLIVSDFSRSPSSVANVEEASTRGAELSLLWVAPAGVEARVSYAYLEAWNDTSNLRLRRRPRHSGNIDLWRDLGRGWSAGAGLRVVAQREDVHAQTFASMDGEDYTVARVYAAWQINERFTLRARVENALDESYEEVHGFPQLPVGAFASLECRW